MKRVISLFTLVACFAALLTSCIKEESYKAETVNLEVKVTRAGESTSQQQGDQITDVMIWAFQKTGDVVSNTPSGWRTYTPSSSTFTSVTVHIPLPMCNGSANYRLVAVINKDKFGTIVKADGTPLTLNATTSYKDLTSARFASDVVDETLNEAKPGTPAVMPVSHWKDVEVKDVNLHASNCKSVDMSVYRAVAKTQLFVARNSQFQLELHEVTLVNAAAEAQGVILSQANDVSSPSWFVQNPTLTKGNYSKQLVTSSNVYKISPDDATFIYNDNSVLKSAQTGHDVAHYVCGKVIYETASKCAQTGDTYQAVPTGNGYYYKIIYKIGNNGDELIRYVPLPAIVRNHDYQVRAFIKEDGGIVVNYTVADWEEVKWDLAFDAAQHTLLLPALSDTGDDNDYDDAEPTTYPTITFTGEDNETGAAVFYFKMMGPTGITWKPTLKSVSADDFAVRVYEVKNDSNNLPIFDNNGRPSLATEQTVGDIPAEGDQFYAVKVVALHSGAISKISDAKPIELLITHAPQWNEEKDNSLVINPNSGTSPANYFWPAKVNNAPDRTVGNPTMVYIYPGTNN